MNKSEFQAMMAATFQRLEELSDTKGIEYAGAIDRLANFKRSADRNGITPLKAWGVFYGKHDDAIFNFIQSGRVLSEPIEGRIDDAILYLILLKGLVAETKDQTVKS